MKRTFVILGAILLAAAVVGAGFIVWYTRPQQSKVYTDGELRREAEPGITPRDVLWSDPEQLPPALNGDATATEPALSRDGLTMIFVRGEAGNNADLYIVTRDASGWGTARPLTTINSSADELSPELSADGRTLIFASDRPGGQGGYDLWASILQTGGEWSPPVHLGSEINSDRDEYAPALSPDERQLYFASNRPAADEPEETRDLPAEFFQRNFDIYLAQRDNPNAPLGQVQPIDALNTPHNDTGPAISEYSDFIYFASDRPGGEGGYDLYRARIVEGAFLDPANLAPPLNTTADELDPSVSNKGFGLIYAVAGTDTDGLYAVTSREVFSEVITSRAEIDWQQVLRTVGPWLIMLIILVLIILLLLKYLGSEQGKALGLFARCLLASLLVHLLMLIGLAFWGVSHSLTDLLGERQGVRVALFSPSAGGGVAGQIRGELTQVEIDTQQPQPAARSAAAVAEVPIQAVTHATAAARSDIDTDPQRVITEARATEAQPQTDSAQAVELTQAATAPPATATPEPQLNQPTEAPQQVADADADAAAQSPSTTVETTAQSRVDAPAVTSAATSSEALVQPDATAVREAQSLAGESSDVMTDAQPSRAAAALDTSATSARVISPTTTPGDIALPGFDLPATEQATAESAIEVAAAVGDVTRQRTNAAESTDAPTDSGATIAVSTSAAAAGDTLDRASMTQATATDAANPATSAPESASALTPVADLPMDLALDLPTEMDGGATTQPAAETTEVVIDAPSMSSGAPRAAAAITDIDDDTAQPTLAVEAATGTATVGELDSGRRFAESQARDAMAADDAPLGREPSEMAPAGGPARMLASDLPRMEEDTALPMPPEARDLPDATIAAVDQRRAVTPDAAAPENDLALAPTDVDATDARDAAMFAETPATLDAPLLRDPDIAPPTRPSQLDLPALIVVDTQPKLDELAPPDAYAQRAPEKRQEVIEQMGGSAETERAVKMALAWLARQQRPDGQWDGKTFDDGAGGAARANVEVALTGLSLLCFLATDHTHIKDGPYQDNVRRALDWMLTQQGEDGSLIGGESMYSHGIATIALAEAYAMTNDQKLFEPVQRACDFIYAARNTEVGGWRYGPGQVGDTSVMGWQIMALKSAKRGGVDIPPAAFDVGSDWLKIVESDNRRGLYAYQPDRAVSPAMTAEGMFVNQLLGATPEEAGMDEASRYILRHLPEWEQANTYYWYYATLALFQHHEAAWNQWNERIKDELVNNQNRNGRATGSWNVQGQWSSVGGRVYQTTMCCLTLQVYYRYLPMYMQE